MLAAGCMMGGCTSFPSSLHDTTNSRTGEKGSSSTISEPLPEPSYVCAPVHVDYINFMKQVTPETTQEYMTQLKRFNMGAPGESDCPVFDGMYEYFAVSLLPKHLVWPSHCPSSRHCTSSRRFMPCLMWS